MIEDRRWPFPVPPKDLVRVFLTERGRIRSEADMRVFIRRWLPLWLAFRIPKQDTAFLRGVFPKRFLRRFFTAKDPAAKKLDFRSRSTRMATHLVLPRALVHCSMKAREYGVPTSVALEQFFDVYEPDPYAEA